MSIIQYDPCPVDLCVNLLSALDSRNGVISMRTSPHLRALLINNNPCGQQFSLSRFTAGFDASTGTYNDLCNIIFYFRKLQAPRNAHVCGATCGMHVSAGLLTNFSDISDLKYAMALCLPIYSSSIWHKLSTRHVERPSTIWRNHRKQNYSAVYCSESGPRPRHSSAKCGWRHDSGREIQFPKQIRIINENQMRKIIISINDNHRRITA